ncbi:MAG: hypothetical protein HN782_07605 [Candidatus Marinimicrobia bacterium]|nr:hypothetical protein [Candidatus Neomarinimicrobiota bacterium]
MRTIILMILLFYQNIFSQEVFPVEIPLNGEAKDRDLEFSGLTWYKENLILLPQYVKKEDPGFYTISKKDLINWIDANQEKAIKPKKIKIELSDIREKIEGFQGFEAITFIGNKAYMIIESKNNGIMKSFLIKGKLNFRKLNLVIDSKIIKEIPLPVNIKNMGFESILKYQHDLMVLYEANGENINNNPLALTYNSSLNPKNPIAFPNLEYRLTDVTELDSKNNFWAINYFWPGEKERLNPGKDLIIEDIKEGMTHKRYEHVERLVEFKIESDKLIRTSTPPIQLVLEEKSRNWEGLVRFEDKGFLMIVDEHPRTLLAFIPKP